MSNFELKSAELLPPLDQETIDNITKFIRLNVVNLLEQTRFEPCCFHDDISSVLSAVGDTLYLGAGVVTIKELLDNYGIAEEDEDDE